MATAPQMPYLLKLLRYFFNGSAQRVVALQLAVAAALGLAAYVVWNFCAVEIRSQEIYWVKNENIRVLNPPIWIPNDFIKEALKYRPPNRRNQPNSLDPNLKNELLAAFNSHPWTDKVEQIVVTYPSKITLRVKFKEPVAVVDPTKEAEEDFEDIGGANAVKTPQNQEESDVSLQYVVDATGYRLPDDYFRKNPKEYSKFVKILGIHSTPVSNFGHSIDSKVAEAAAFVDFLLKNNAPSALGIDRVLVSKNDGAARGTYTLLTKDNRTTVFWGYFTPETTDAPENAEPTSNETGTPRESFERQQEKLRKLFEIASDGSKREIDLSGISPKKMESAEKYRPKKGEKSQKEENADKTNAQSQ